LKATKDEDHTGRMESLMGRHVLSDGSFCSYAESFARFTFIEGGTSGGQINTSGATLRHDNKEKVSLSGIIFS